MIFHTRFYYYLKIMFGKGNIQIFGTGTIGERGQIVVPADLREKMKIIPGDKFVFIGSNEAIHMVKAAELTTMLEKLSRHLHENLQKIKKQLK